MNFIENNLRAELDRPVYGSVIGRITPEGVRFTDDFEKFIDAIVGIATKGAVTATAGAIPDVRFTDVDTTTTDNDDVIICTNELTVTLHTPDSDEPLKPKRIKRYGLFPVTVSAADQDGYVLNVNYQAIDVQWTGSEWISL